MEPIDTCVQLIGNWQNRTTIERMLAAYCFISAAVFTAEHRILIFAFVARWTFVPRTASGFHCHSCYCNHLNALLLWRCDWLIAPSL
ncbi:MAG: hypothetical protein DWI00_07725 [Planctomycetota bacterium]|nr:MAG: hypothetical protein DWI00_07725 [Planctomycetota bacterium]